MAKTLCRTIAIVILILIAFGTIGSLFSWALFLLLLVVLVFILVAHYVHSNALRNNPPKEEMDLGTEHPIRMHKLVPDGDGMDYDG